MTTSPTRILGFTLSAALAIGGLLVTMPANADPTETTSPTASAEGSSTASASATSIPVSTPGGESPIILDTATVSTSTAVPSSTSVSTPTVAPPVTTSTPATTSAPATTSTPAATATSAVATTSAPAAGPNLIEDAALRTCLAQMMWTQGIGSSPGSPEYQTQTQSITQADLDSIAKATIYSFGCSGVSTLNGLENLHDSKLQGLSFYNGQVQDLSPLSGFTGLMSAILYNNKITDLAPLAGLTNLMYLDVSNNQISDLGPVAGLSKLSYLYANNNQIANVAPLAGLTSLTQLNLGDNKITDISPIAPLLNTANADGNPKVKWTLANNQIIDSSSLDWALANKAWLAIPSEYQTGVFAYTVTGQTVPVQSSIAGATIALPQVKHPGSDPYDLTWKVTGDATINKDGTVTFNSAGPVILKWMDDMTVQCPTSSSGNPLCPSNAAKLNLSIFSGTVNVNVSSGQPSVPQSDVAKDEVKSPETTGGAARLADGSDTYTLVTTIRDEKDQPLTGYGDRLTVSASSEIADASNVRFSTFREDEKEPGSYLLDVFSDVPGNYVVTVKLGGAPLETTTPDGAPLYTTSTPVNFIGADITQLTRLIGETQSSQGLGFLPGEEVTVEVHSDPMTLGTYTADSKGNLSVDFLTDKLDLGRHTVNFIGITSGTVKIGFDVVSPPSKNPRAGTGGTSIMGTSGRTALVLAFSLAAAAVFSLTMGMRRRTR